MRRKLNDLAPDVVVPNPRLMLRPLIETPLPSVKVVFLGREPIFGRWQNDGFAYSTSDPIVTLGDAPPAFQEIVKEAVTDVGIPVPKVATLRNWAKQGVLLWNTLPTCRRGYSNSHINMGWESLTEEILETVYLQNPQCVFILFSNIPSGFRQILPTEANTIYAAAPSKWGHGVAENFSGSRVFSRTNQILRVKGFKPIDWRIK